MSLDELIEQSNRQEVSRFKDSLNRYLKKWPWLLLSVFIALVSAFLYLKIKPNRYNVSSKVQIKKSQQIENPSDILFGNRLGRQFMNGNDETVIFNSFPLIKKTVEALKFDVSYYKKDGFGQTEIYTKTPIVFDFERNGDINLPQNIVFEIQLIDNRKFLIVMKEPFQGETLNGQYNFSQVIKLGDFSFKILKSDKFNQGADFKDTYLIRTSSIISQTYAYINKVNFEKGEGFSTILTLSVKSTVPEKSKDFINTLINNYIEQNLTEKNQVAKKTVEFIDKQLATISDSLNAKEKNLESFKSSESLSSLSVEGEVLINRYNEIESEKAKYEVIQQYYDYLQEKLENHEGQNIENLIAPSAFGIQDLIVNDLVKTLVELNLTKSNIEGEGNTKNPFYDQLENQRLEIVKTLKASVKNLVKANKIILTDLNKRSKKMTLSAQQLPANERKLVNLNRLLQLNENIYLFLMEKRSTAAIQMSSSTPDCKVIEPAMLNPLGPISPNRRMVYLIAIVIGLFIPSMIIVAFDFLNDTIQSKEDTESATSLPLLGILPNSKGSNNQFVAIERPKSALAESFRLVRANLSFFQKKKFPFVIMLTSTVAKEGKTFCGINLASALAASGKATVLLGFDLRKPQIHNYLNLNNDKGLSNYLASSLSLDEIIKPSKQENLSIILSGSIPPNPSELLMTERIKVLFEELRQKFEYIVMDTPPVGLVADARILCQESDLNIYVVRQGFSKREYLNNANDLSSSNKIKNLCIILNDSKKGNKYGSGYYE